MRDQAFEVSEAEWPGRQKERSQKGVQTKENQRGRVERLITELANKSGSPQVLWDRLGARLEARLEESGQQTRYRYQDEQGHWRSITYSQFSNRVSQ